MINGDEFFLQYKLGCDNIQFCHKNPLWFYLSEPMSKNNSTYGLVGSGELFFWFDPIL